MSFTTHAFQLTICIFFASLFSINAQFDANDGMEITSHMPFTLSENFATFEDCDYDDPEKKKACFNANLKQHFVKNFKVPSDSISQNFDGKVYFKFYIDNDGKIDSTAVYDRLGAELIQEEITKTLEKLPVLHLVKSKDTLIKTAYSLYAKFTPNQSTRFRVIDIGISKELVKKEGDDEDKEVSFAIIDEVPIFPGCENETKANLQRCFQQKIQKHIQKNFRYPEEVQELGISGRVLLIFVISDEGNIENIRTRGPHPLLELEGRRIISKLPKMSPGKQNGKRVRVPFAIPLSFRLQ